MTQFTWTQFFDPYRFVHSHNELWVLSPVTSSLYVQIYCDVPWRSLNFAFSCANIAIYKDTVLWPHSLFVQLQNELWCTKSNNLMPTSSGLLWCSMEVHVVMLILQSIRTKFFDPYIFVQLQNELQSTKSNNLMPTSSGLLWCSMEDSEFCLQLWCYICS